ncbi:MAG: hypothetical protein QOI80_66 [Solirubrobacteraceae bacterium]|jgi:hypothetical protein|nr:hypothetical protein [Solirubrobacteraceae bacterium]
MSPAAIGNLTPDDALNWLPNWWERLNRNLLSSALTNWALGVVWGVLAPKFAYKARFVERLRGRRVALYVVFMALLGIAVRALYELAAARVRAEANAQGRHP